MLRLTESDVLPEADPANAAAAEQKRAKAEVLMSNSLVVVVERRGRRNGRGQRESSAIDGPPHGRDHHATRLLPRCAALKSFCFQHDARVL